MKTKSLLTLAAFLIMTFTSGCATLPGSHGENGGYVESLGGKYNKYMDSVTPEFAKAKPPEERNNMWMLIAFPVAGGIIGYCASPSQAQYFGDARPLGALLGAGLGAVIGILLSGNLDLFFNRGVSYEK